MFRVEHHVNATQPEGQKALWGCERHYINVTQHQPHLLPRGSGCACGPWPSGWSRQGWGRWYSLPWTGPWSAWCGRSPCTCRRTAGPGGWYSFPVKHTHEKHTHLSALMSLTSLTGQVPEDTEIIRYTKPQMTFPFSVQRRKKDFIGALSAVLI